MKLTKNVISLRKGFVTALNDIQDNRIMVSTVQAHLMQYAYMLDEDAFEALSKSDASFIQNFHDETISYLKEITGGKKNFTALYKNFPQEVMSLSDSELFWNAIRHYWSNGTWEPKSPDMERQVKFEKIKYNMLKAGSEQDFLNIFTTLVSVNTSLTPTDLDIVKWFVENSTLVFPDAIPFKENLCTLAGMGLDVPVKTTTDVLRIAVHLSGGDISLPKVPAALVKTNRWSSAKSYNYDRDAFRFKKFTRKERKYLLGLLEKTNCDTREMILRDQRWIRLGEILHPGEYKNQYPRAFEAFNKIRNEKVESWYGQLNKAFSKSLEAGLAVLSQRPGEFVRRIDYLVRTYTKQLDVILNAFAEVSKTASNKVLFEVYDHFEKRAEPIHNRSIMIKGSRKRTELPDLPAIKPQVIETIHSTIFTQLREKFTKLDPLGNVWIDEELKKIPLPSNMRSMSESMKPVIRGQRIPFENPDAKVIRPFVHWVDNNGREDLDISATFVGNQRVDVLSFSSLRIGKSCHSGDVRHRRGNCAEYIDIDIADAVKNGYRYVVVDVRNFNGGSLKSVDTLAGFMYREHPTKNSAWLPETLSNTSVLESSSTNTLICIVDVVEKEYIMLDIDSDGSTFARGDVKNILKSIEQYTQAPKVSVYDLLMLHVEARGRKVELTHPDGVDTQFKYEDFCYSYEKIATMMI